MTIDLRAAFKKAQGYSSAASAITFMTVFNSISILMSEALTAALTNKPASPTFIAISTVMGVGGYMVGKHIAKKGDAIAEEAIKAVEAGATPTPPPAP